MANLGDAIFRIKVLVQGINKLDNVPKKMGEITKAAINVYNNVLLVKQALANFGDAADFVDKVSESVKRLNQVLTTTVKKLAAIVALRAKLAKTPPGGNQNQNATNPGKNPNTNTQDKVFEPVAGASYFNKLAEAAQKSKKVFNDSFGNIIKGITQVRIAFRNFSKGNNTKAFNNLRDAFLSLKTGIVNGAAQIGSGLISAGQSIKQFGFSIRQASFILRDAGIQLIVFGGVISGFVSLFVASNAEFEQAIADTSSVITGLQDGSVAAGEKIAVLSEQILALAETTKFTALEIAEGAKVLGLAGFSYEEVADALEGITTLAAATGATIKDAADLQATIIRSFGLSAKSAQEVSDVLTATVTNANTDITKLQESFKIASPAAAAFGQTIQETAAALGVLANSGLRSSIAGTGLSRVLTQLVENAELADEVLGRLGSSFAAIDPRNNKLSDIVKEFERLGVGANTLGQLFDQRAFRSLQAIINQGSQAFDVILAQINVSQGLSRKIAAIRLDTLTGDVLILKSAFESLKITLGALLNVDLRSYVTTITDLLTKVTSFVKTNQSLSQSALKIATSVGVTSAALGVLLFTMGSVAAAAVPFVIAIGSMISALGSLTVATTITVFVLGSEFLPLILTIAAAVTAIVAPFAAAAAAFISLGVAITAALSTGVINTAVESSKALSQVLQSIGTIISNTILPALAGFQMVVDSQLVPAFKALLVEVQLLFLELGSGTASSSDEFYSFGMVVAGVLTEIIKWVTNFVRFLRENKQLIIDFGTLVVQAFTGIGSAALALIKVIDFLSRSMFDLATLAFGVVTANGPKTATALLAIASAGSKSSKGIEEAEMALKKLQNALEGFSSGEFKKFTDLLDESSDLQNKYNKLLELIQKLPELNGTQAIELGDLLGDISFNDITNEVNFLLSKVKELKEERTKLVAEGKDTFSIDGLIKRYETAAEKLQDSLSKAENALSDALRPSTDLVAEREDIKKYVAGQKDLLLALGDAASVFERDRSKFTDDFLPKFQDQLLNLNIKLDKDSTVADITEAISAINADLNKNLERSQFLNSIIPQSEEIKKFLSEATAEANKLGQVLSKEDIAAGIAGVFARAAQEADEFSKKASEVDKAVNDIKESSKKSDEVSQLSSLITESEKLLEVEKKRFETAVSQGASDVILKGLQKNIDDRLAQIQFLNTRIAEITTQAADELAEDKKKRDQELADDELSRKRELVDGILDEDQKYVAERALIQEEAAAREKKEFEKVAEALKDETDAIIKARQAQVKSDLDAILAQDLAALDASFQEAQDKKNKEKLKEKNKQVEFENSITNELLKQLESIGQANALLAFRNKIQAQNEARAKRAYERELQLEKRLQLLQKLRDSGKGGPRINDRIQTAEETLNFQRALTGKRLSDAELVVDRTKGGIQQGTLQATLLDAGFVANLGKTWGVAIADVLKAELSNFVLKVDTPGKPKAGGGGGNNSQNPTTVVNDNRVFNIQVENPDDVYPYIV